MPMSRVSMVLLFTLSAMSALGRAQSAAPANRQLAIDLARIDALNRNVVAADFNGDGLIDLAASAAVPSSAGSVSSTGVLSTPNGFVAFAGSVPGNGIAVPTSSAASQGNPAAVSSAGNTSTVDTTAQPSGVAVSGNSGSAPNRTVTAGGGRVAVFGSGVTAPNTRVATPNNSVTMPPGNVATLAGGNVTVFGSGVTVPNTTVFPSAAGSALTANAAPSVAGASAVSPGNVAVFGNRVSTPNAGPPLSYGAAPVAGSVGPFSVTNAGAAVTSPPAPTSGSAAAPVTTIAPLVTAPVNAAAAGATAAQPNAAAPVDNGVSFAGTATPAETGVAFVSAASVPGPVVVMLGLGNGTFRAPIRSSISGDVLAAGDFNADKKTDLVVVTQPDSQVLVLQGNGDGTFRAAYPVGAPAAPPASTTATSTSTNLTSTTPASAASTSTSGETPAQAGAAKSEAAQAGGLVKTTITFASAADLDGDGKLDLVVGMNPGGGRVFPGSGNFTFGTPVELVAGQSPNDGIVVDVNGDRASDIIIANRIGQSISIFLNQGALLFTPSDMPLDRRATDVAAADFNRDGKTDLVVTVAGGGDGETQFADGFAYVLLGRGDGTFAQPVQYSVAPGAWQVALGDFTADGILDIATANRSSSLPPTATARPGVASDTISILPGNGDGTFGQASSVALSASAAGFDGRFRASVRSLSVSDMNGDQKADLVVSGGAVLLSRAAGRTTTPTSATPR
jgi:hypothetical protein